jgi:hypothetical protein
MRIETQSIVALSYRIVRAGLNRRQQGEERLSRTFVVFVFFCSTDFSLNSHLRKVAWLPRITLSTINFSDMKSPTEHLWFEVPDRRGFINITPTIEELVHQSGVTERLCLVNAMHITASVFINDDGPGIHHDYEQWLEKLAPHAPTNAYRHNRTGEDKR